MLLLQTASINKGIVTNMNNSNSIFSLGADGCNGGWIVAVLGSNLRIERFSSIGEILKAYPDYSALLIDMVIGLRDSAKQLRPDDIARKELKPRGATLFPVPSREAVYKETYEEQKKSNIKSLGKSLPKQASAIIPKIREVDEFMTAHPEYKNRIDESHPELDFARLNGSVLLTRKKDADGIEERLKVIKRFIPGIKIPDLYAKAKDLRCNVDDIADAICLAVTAKLKLEGLCETIPENPQMDSNGLYMKLTVPKKAVSNGMTEISRLKSIVEMLRSENGCSWDKVQTHSSLKAACLEEAAEVVGGINILEKTGDAANLREELGDLLLQVMFHSVIAEEEGLFTFEDVAKTISDKMVRRHPHVFAGVKYASEEELHEAWAAIKKEEKKGREWEADYLEEALNEASELIEKAKERKLFKDKMAAECIPQHIHQMEAILDTAQEKMDVLEQRK
ncbi:MAG: DUF429 domain-containing protein [Butyrivibrio sp.]|nr:DUF429 domain-containing protein [Butyrivibrio sp.]